LSRRAAAGERGPLHCVRRMNDGGSHAKRGGALPPPKWKATSPSQAQAGVRPAVGAITTFCRKTSPRPRAFRPPAPVAVGGSGATGGVRLCKSGNRV
jgi:hypothetical protein